MNHVDLLRRLDACDEAIEWYGDRDSEDAWRECQHGDWMLWIASKIGVDRKRIVMASCDCVEPALQFVPDGEDRPRAAVDAARAWCQGAASYEEVRAAAAVADALANAAFANAAFANAAVADAAYADAAYAYAYYAAYAAAASAYYAAYAAYAATATHYASSAASSAAAAYAYAYYAAHAANATHYAAAARTQSLAASADIVRRHIPWDVVREALAKLEA